MLKIQRKSDLSYLQVAPLGHYIPSNTNTEMGGEGVREGEFRRVNQKWASTRVGRLAIARELPRANVVRLPFTFWEIVKRRSAGT